MGSYHYRAFLSYSHRDRRWADWFHKSLERFRIDDHLVARQTSAGIVPKRLSPVFRDRDDFAAGSSLNDQTVAALAASHSLVVLCSPRSAKSLYVDEEIRYFKSLGRADRVIAVILEGEPGDPNSECFPDALRFHLGTDGTPTGEQAAPIAADVRPAGDGRRLALLKVVAGLTGLPLDDIRKRDIITQRRRISWIAAACIIMGALSIAGGGGVWLYWRHEQRLDAQAEQVKQITATLLMIAPAQAAPGRDQAVGVAVRAAVAGAAAGDPSAQKALDLLKAGKTDEAAALYRAMADEDAAKVATVRKEAASNYRNAAAIAGLRDPKTARELYAKALESDPDDREALSWSASLSIDAGSLETGERLASRLLSLAAAAHDTAHVFRSQLMLGDVLVARGHLSAALDRYKEGLAIAERLAQSDPGNASWQHDLSLSDEKIGDVLVGQGDLPGALKSYRDSLAIREPLTQSDPANAGWQRDLSVSDIKIGDVLVGQGDVPGALKTYRDGLAIAERLAQSDPGNAGWQRDLSVSDDKIGNVLVAKGYLPEALKSYRDAFAISERLAQSDPGNAGWQRDLSVFDEKIGDVLVAQGDLPGALKSYRDSLAIRERLSQSDPGNAGWQRDLSVSDEKIGDILVAQGDVPGALKSYRAARVISEPLAQSDRGNAGWQRDLSVSNNRVGDILMAQGDVPGAMKSYRDSLAIDQRLAQSDPGNAGSQRDLSVSDEKIGDVLVAQDDVPGALKSYRDSLAIRERLAQSDPGNAGWQRNLAVSYSKIGDVLVAQGDLPGALKSYRASLVIIERLAQSDPGNAGWQRDLSISEDRAGDVLVTQGDRIGAMKSYRDSLAIRERLAQSDPGNAAWQRDVIISCVKLAAPDQPQARTLLARALGIAKQMRDRGQLAPTDLWMVDDLAKRIAALPA